MVLAAGTETGSINILFFHVDKSPGAAFLRFSSSETLSSPSLPKSVRQLAWRPCEDDHEKNDAELAIAGDDSSLRICRIVLKTTE